MRYFQGKQMKEQVGNNEQMNRPEYVNQTARFYKCILSTTKMCPSPMPLATSEEIKA